MLVPLFRPADGNSFPTAPTPFHQMGDWGIMLDMTKVAWLDSAVALRRCGRTCGHGQTGGSVVGRLDLVKALEDPDQDRTRLAEQCRYRRKSASQLDPIRSAL